MESSDRPLLLIERLRVTYPGSSAPVIDGASLSLGRAEIGCVVGSSGCGKTTLLRAIAGFVGVEDGTIEIAGAVVSGPHFTAATERRGIGLVFQDYALFPHLRVQDNIGFGLRALGPAERTARIQEMIDLVGLAPHAAHYPHELS
jgi:iron(III) transport system ATP-binding protein